MNYDMRFTDKETKATQARALAIINSVTREASSTGRAAVARRAGRIAKILSGKKPDHERLALVAGLLPAENRKAQQTLVWGHACALEINSAGLPILFERFSRQEIARIDRALDTIGARTTRQALARLRARLDKAIAGGKRRLDASEELGNDPAVKRITKQSDKYVREIERRLLAYCKKHVEELAGA